MRRSLCALILLGLLLSPIRSSSAGVTITAFENLGFPANSYDQNAASSGFFSIDGNSFNNRYNATYDSWSGWALSSKTDTTTEGYTNQYSAITGSGADGSAAYAVAFTFGYPTADTFHPSDSYINLAAGASPLSVAVTNTTYAYLTMKYGDPYGFSQPFVTGDYLLLTVRGYSGLGGLGAKIGEVDFYLADFRSGLPANQYIVNTWQTFDLSSLAGAGSLVFGLISTDNDPYYGMNTPAYFALDDFQFSTASAAVPEPTSLLMLLGGVGGLCLFRCIRRGTAVIGSLIVVGSLGVGAASAGIYDPQVGQPGSQGIPKSSPYFVEWASSVVSYNPGPVDITNPHGASASFGSPSNALGGGTGNTPYGVVSLGDGGSITLGFDTPIANGSGADFAVFENGFLSGSNGLAFLELAFVDVSSDGVNFFRFPSVSLTQTTTQIGGFGLIDASNLHNLAGKFIAGYGTGFDLQELWEFRHCLTSTTSSRSGSPT